MERSGGGGLWVQKCCSRRHRPACVTVTVLGFVIAAILLAFFAFGQEQPPHSTLLLVSVIFRHGDRTPTETYATDPYRDDSTWTEGWGSLTNVGKQQLFQLGKYLRTRYTGFLDDLYSPKDMQIKSSAHDRCLMSGQMVLAGLYPPKGSQIWNPDLEWQPIPVHSTPLHMDNLIVMRKPCARYDQELQLAYKSPKIMQLNQENAKLYEYLTENAGQNITNITDVEFLYNTLEIEVIGHVESECSLPPSSYLRHLIHALLEVISICHLICIAIDTVPSDIERDLIWYLNQDSHGLTLPDWTKTVYPDRMRPLAAVSLAIFTHSNTQKRLRGGPLVHEIVQHMEEKRRDSLRPNRKLFLYSAHDLTIVNIWRTLGFSDLLKPDYGAALFIELHRTRAGTNHEVQLLYLNNTYTRNLRILNMPGCGHPCYLDTFLRLVHPVTPADWEQECQTTLA